jgi:hypothetical protein
LQLIALERTAPDWWVDASDWREQFDMVLGDRVVRGSEARLLAALMNDDEAAFCEEKVRLATSVELEAELWRCIDCTALGDCCCCFVVAQLCSAGDPERLSCLLEVGFRGSFLRVSTLRTAVEQGVPSVSACLHVFFSKHLDSRWLMYLATQFAVNEPRQVVECVFVFAVTRSP